MSDTEDYPVGYKKPPKHSQFQKGQSGNPGGKRRPVATSINTALAGALAKRVTVTDEAGDARMSQLEALMGELVKKARAGNTGCMKLVLGLLQTLESRTDARLELETLCQKAVRDEARELRADDSPTREGWAEAPPGH